MHDEAIPVSLEIGAISSNIVHRRLWGRESEEILKWLNGLIRE
jgi:hypothetical protein